VNLLVAVVLAAMIFGLGWAFFAALGAVLRWAGVFPAVPPPRGPQPGHCPCCGCAVIVVACDGGGGC
jgi:hypothetical protein